MTNDPRAGGGSITPSVSQSKLLSQQAVVVEALRRRAEIHSPPLAARTWIDWIERSGLRLDLSKDGRRLSCEAAVRFQFEVALKFGSSLGDLTSVQGGHGEPVMGFAE